MLLQTNSYIVPRDKRMEHARLLRRFRQTLLRLGCDHFEVYEQVGTNWNTGETTGRFVQIMRFRDRKHQLDVQAAERSDATAQALVREFCELINFPYQQQQGLFAVGFYTSFLRMPPQRTTTATSAETIEPGSEQADDADAVQLDAGGEELGGGHDPSGAGDSSGFIDALAEDPDENGQGHSTPVRGSGGKFNTAGSLLDDDDDKPIV